MTKNETLQLVSLICRQFALLICIFKWHLFERDGAIYYYYRTLCPCQPGYEQTKAPPPPGSSAHPCSQTGTNTGRSPLAAAPILARPGPMRGPGGPRMVQRGPLLRGTVVSLFHPLTKSYLLSVQHHTGWTVHY